MSSRPRLPMSSHVFPCRPMSSLVFACLPCLRLCLCSSLLVIVLHTLRVLIAQIYIAFPSRNVCTTLVLCLSSRVLRLSCACLVFVFCAFPSRAIYRFPLQKRVLPVSCACLRVSCACLVLVLCVFCVCLVSFPSTSRIYRFSMRFSLQKTACATALLFSVSQQCLAPN